MLDENGYGRIVGRIKDMVIRGGENIYPREIEELLHTHPSVQEAQVLIGNISNVLYANCKNIWQVIGVPDARLGEEVCAWIRLKSGSQATEEDLKTFCKERVNWQMANKLHKPQLKSFYFVI